MTRYQTWFGMLTLVVGTVGLSPKVCAQSARSFLVAAPNGYRLRVGVPDGREMQAEKPYTWKYGIAVEGEGVLAGLKEAGNEIYYAVRPTVFVRRVPKGQSSVPAGVAETVSVIARADGLPAWRMRLDKIDKTNAAGMRQYLLVAPTAGLAFRLLTPETNADRADAWFRAVELLPPPPGYHEAPDPHPAIFSQGGWNFRITQPPNWFIIPPDGAEIGGFLWKGGSIRISLHMGKTLESDSEGRAVNGASVAKSPLMRRDKRRALLLTQTPIMPGTMNGVSTTYYFSNRLYLLEARKGVVLNVEASFSTQDKAERDRKFAAFAAEVDTVFRSIEALPPPAPSSP